MKDSRVFKSPVSYPFAAVGFLILLVYLSDLPSLVMSMRAGIASIILVLVMTAIVIPGSLVLLRLGTGVVLVDDANVHIWNAWKHTVVARADVEVILMPELSTISDKIPRATILQCFDGRSIKMLGIFSGHPADAPFPRRLAEYLGVALALGDELIIGRQAGAMPRRANGDPANADPQDEDCADGWARAPQTENIAAKNALRSMGATVDPEPAPPAMAAVAAFAAPEPAVTPETPTPRVNAPTAPPMVAAQGAPAMSSPDTAHHRGAGAAWTPPAAPVAMPVAPPTPAPAPPAGGYVPAPFVAPAPPASVPITPEIAASLAGSIATPNVPTPVPAPAPTPAPPASPMVATPATPAPSPTPTPWTPAAPAGSPSQPPASQPAPVAAWQPPSTMAPAAPVAAAPPVTIAAPTAAAAVAHTGPQPGMPPIVNRPRAAAPHGSEPVLPPVHYAVPAAYSPPQPVHQPMPPAMPHGMQPAMPHPQAAAPGVPGNPYGAAAPVQQPAGGPQTPWSPVYNPNQSA